jgi:O-acetyl-ADP-ribose deacetylase (regulator of RNase III)
MALVIKHGDLFKEVVKVPGLKVIAHGCNAVGKMGSGFADAVRRKYPIAYMAYREAYLSDGIYMGDVVYVHVDDELTIANCITQHYYGKVAGVKYANTEAIRKCLKQVAAFCKKQNAQLHLPLIGGKRGGLEKDVLINIFKDVFDDVDATLWLSEEHDKTNSYPKCTRLDH